HRVELLVHSFLTRPQRAPHSGKEAPAGRRTTLPDVTRDRSTISMSLGAFRWNRSTRVGGPALLYEPQDRLHAAVDVVVHHERGTQLPGDGALALALLQAAHHGLGRVTPRLQPA